MVLSEAITLSEVNPNWATRTELTDKNSIHISITAWCYQTLNNLTMYVKYHIFLFSLCFCI